jgi:ABC-type nitrate/sulfonate/bicarbonate transport system ATPase subunit
VPAGGFVTVIGPSGSGKSTLFSILTGLEPPTSGSVLSDGREVTGRLDLVAYMPQKDLLLPWRSVLDNVVLGLEVRGVSRREARERARALLPRFGLAGFERHYPATLSGGMRQRAALLRTVLTDRDILLLDEPFGALDALTRMSMQAWLLEIWGDLAKTVMFITHDIDEAIYLSDRIYVLAGRPGRIVATVDVSLPRPRDHDAVVVSSPFTALKSELLSALSLGRAGAV